MHKPLVLTRQGLADAHGKPTYPVLIATVTRIEREPMSGGTEVSLQLAAGLGAVDFILPEPPAFGVGESFGLVLATLADCKLIQEHASEQAQDWPPEDVTTVATAADSVKLAPAVIEGATEPDPHLLDVAAAEPNTPAPNVDVPPEAPPVEQAEPTPAEPAAVEPAPLVDVPPPPAYTPAIPDAGAAS